SPAYGIYRRGVLGDHSDPVDTAHQRGTGPTWPVMACRSTVAHEPVPEAARPGVHANRGDSSGTPWYDRSGIRRARKARRSFSLTAAAGSARPFAVDRDLLVAAQSG